MIDRGKYANLAEALADVADIDKVIQAVVREATIREAMASTGETRAVVVEAIDSVESLGQEAVLNLVEGKPTTLGRGLARYVEDLEARYPQGVHTDSIVAELDALLRYPWPGAGPDDEEMANFRNDVVVTLSRVPMGRLSSAADEIVALAKDRFGPR